MWDFILIQIICRIVWWKNPWKTLSATIFELLFATSNRTMSPFSFPICPTLVYFILLTWLPDKKSCGQKCSNPIVESSWNRRIIKVTMLEVTSKVHGVQPFLGQRALIKLSSITSNCIWKTSTDRDTNTPLGILFKWRVVLPVKKFFLIFDRFCGLPLHPFLLSMIFWNCGEQNRKWYSRCGLTSTERIGMIPLLCVLITSLGMQIRISSVFVAAATRCWSMFV